MTHWKCLFDGILCLFIIEVSFYICVQNIACREVCRYYIYFFYAQNSFRAQLCCSMGCIGKKSCVPEILCEAVPMYMLYTFVEDNRIQNIVPYGIFGCNSSKDNSLHKHCQSYKYSYIKRKTLEKNYLHWRYSFPGNKKANKLRPISLICNFAQDLKCRVKVSCSTWF